MFKQVKYTIRIYILLVKLIYLIKVKYFDILMVIFFSFWFIVFFYVKFNCILNKLTLLQLINYILPSGTMLKKIIWTISRFSKYDIKNDLSEKKMIINQNFVDFLLCLFNNHRLKNILLKHLVVWAGMSLSLSIKWLLLLFICKVILYIY